MNPSRILISAALVLAALVVLAACTNTKTVIVQATPNTSATYHPAHQAATVACGLITCSHGKVGQACTVAGYPGIIVQSSPTQLACDPKPGNFPSAMAAPPLPGQPSPVSTAAHLSSSCSMGWEWTPNADFHVGG
jgi:hypothetical protein